MTTIRLLFALFLLLTLLGSLVRVVRGPTLADRMVVAQLFGTTCVAVLLVRSAEPGNSALRDVAIIFALLSFVAVTAFVRLAPHRSDGEADRQEPEQ